MTTIARKKASLAKQDRLIKEADTFNTEIISPILMNIIEGERTPAFPMTLRTVRNVYGLDALRVFRLMFKLLQRGGRDLNGVGFKSQWVVNERSCRPYIEWTQKPNRTLKCLHEMLMTNGAMEMVWSKSDRTWWQKDMRDFLLKKKRDARKPVRKIIESVKPLSAEEIAQKEALQ